MLVLKRKNGEGIVINEQIRVIVYESGTGGCKVAIDAPREMSIRREELPPEFDAVGAQPVGAAR